jgi:hypothetical protein
MSEEKPKKAEPGPVRAETKQDPSLILALLRNTKLPNAGNHQKNKWWRRKNGSHRIWP